MNKMEGNRKGVTSGLRLRLPTSIALATVAIAVLLALVLAAPTATNFGVENASGDSGTYVLVPVNITNAQNGPIAGIGFDISYNNSVLNVVGIQAGALTGDWDWDLSGYTTYAWGTAVALVYNGNGTVANGSTGSVVLLNFSVLGAPGTTSPMDISNIQLADLNGDVGTAPAKNGMFYAKKAIFDTGRGTYPAISGIHDGTITPNRDIVVHKLYTYSCEGTGGHTEYVCIHGNGVNESASWSGYIGDYQNIDFNKSFILKEGIRYNYTIKTGSYPQIIHEHSKNVTGGEIICTKFTDANGEIYNDWIPAVRFE